jgi:hypothetical protein
VADVRPVDNLFVIFNIEHYIIILHLEHARRTQPHHCRRPTSLENIHNHSHLHPPNILAASGVSSLLCTARAAFEIFT